MRQEATPEIPPPTELAEILRVFDGLDGGEGLMLSNDHYPKSILRELQAQRPCLFDWNVLEMGPTRFRIEVRRRMTEGRRCVTEYLEGDHRRLDAILDEAERLANAGEFAGASERFAEFACGLDRHIAIEEQILFPLFERVTGIATGPTIVMRSEHVRIRELLKRVSAGLEAGDPVALSAQAALEELLSMHNMKEERVLYPMTDQAAGGEREQNALVERMQAF